MTTTDTPVPLPLRGDHVDAWLRAQRDEYPADSIAWGVLDDLLDTYRGHADTGMPLDEHACENGNVDDCHGCYEAAQ